MSDADMTDGNGNFTGRAQTVVAAVLLGVVIWAGATLIDTVRTNTRLESELSRAVKDIAESKAERIRDIAELRAEQSALRQQLTNAALAASNAAIAAAAAASTNAATALAVVNANAAAAAAAAAKGKP